MRKRQRRKRSSSCRAFAAAPRSEVAANGSTADDQHAERYDTELDG